MLLKIAGYFSVFCGIVWLIWPQMLRGWLQWKAGGKLFWLAMGVFFLPLFHFGVKAGLAGVLGIFVVIFLVKKMIGTALREALLQVPVLAYRGVGLLSFISGVFMLWPK